MCSGVEVDGRIITFADPAPELPVFLRNGEVRWLPWGARHGVPSPWVAGTCARLDSIRAGKWDRYRPVPVRIPVDRLMERDSRNRPYWARLAGGQWLQGLVAQVGDEQRVYVVTVDTPAEYRHVSDRWPRVMGPDGESA